MFPVRHQHLHCNSIKAAITKVLYPSSLRWLLGKQFGMKLTSFVWFWCSWLETTRISEGVVYNHCSQRVWVYGSSDRDLAHTYELWNWRRAGEGPYFIVNYYYNARVDTTSILIFMEQVFPENYIMKWGWVVPGFHSQQMNFKILFLLLKDNIHTHTYFLKIIYFKVMQYPPLLYLLNLLCRSNHIPLIAASSVIYLPISK